MNFLSIPDIHGRSEWKIATHGSIKLFDKWAIELFNGNLVSEGYTFNKYDKIIFIGDYVDSFNERNIIIKKNLEDIILFKKAFPDKVILLLGNHDVSYKNGSEHRCSGYRPEAQYDLKDLFDSKINGEDIFHIAYQRENWLWTHAGITMGFYVECIKNILKEKNSKYSVFFNDSMSIADILNTMYSLNHPDIFRVSFTRGGSSTIPGPLWTDKKELMDKPAFDLNQVVGHTQGKDILGYHFNSGRYEGKDQRIFFIDAMANEVRNYLTLEEIDGKLVSKVLNENDL